MIKEIKIAFEEYTTLNELTEPDKLLCLEAEKALGNSHSPYSGFRVGVVLQLKSSKLIYGSNQENVAYPSGLCAERVALFYWGANHPGDPIETIVITAHTEIFPILQPITPCGSCLQVMAEYEKKQDRKIRVILYCASGPVWIANGVETFLPFLFFEDQLKHQL